MRYGIFSDIHSNLEALEAVLNAYSKESIDKYLCVGDVVGYATDIKVCITKVKEITDITVAGNHDWAAVDLFSLDFFNEQAKEALIWTRERIDDFEVSFLKSLRLIFKNEDLTLVHGSLNEPEEFNYMVDGEVAAQAFRLMDTGICFVGHSHIAGVFIEDDDRIYYREKDAITIDIQEENKYIVNVGSVGQPRDHNPQAAYCIYDTNKMTVSIKRIGYDIDQTRRKIIEAGLPVSLADRLFIGK